MQPVKTMQTGPLERSGAFETCRDSDRGGTFDAGAFLVPQPRHRGGDGGFRHQDDVVDPLLHIMEGEFANAAFQAIAKRGDSGMTQQRSAIAPGALHRRRGFRLDADDAHRRTQGPQDATHPGQEPAAADGDQDASEIRNRLQDLETERAAVSRHHHRMIERGHEGGIVLGHPPPGFSFGSVVAVRMHHVQTSAQRLQRRPLHHRTRARNEHDGWDRRITAGVGDTESMISRRGRDPRAQARVEVAHRECPPAP